MDPLTITAAGGMRARLESLDRLANNLANVSTPGFKPDREFYNLYISPESLAAASAGEGYAQPAIPSVDRQWTDFGQGTLTPSGNALDLALQGKGFFVVDGPNGPLYTRNGSFHLAPDGKLATREGYPVASESGERIQANPNLALDIRPDGTLLQEGKALGRLKLVGLPEDGSALKRDATYFYLSDPRPALPGSSAEVLQHRLEQANFSPSEAAVRLISVMRQFETLQRALQIGGEMNRRAAEEVARVNP